MNRSAAMPLAPHRTNAALVVLGAALLALCAKGIHSQEYGRVVTFAAGALTMGAVYAAAGWIVLRAAAARSTLVIALVFAAGFRLVALVPDPYLSTDIYRYIWDGRVQAAGINPYKYLPADAHLAHLRDAIIYPHINRPNYAKTIYPPMAQGVFLGVTRLSESSRAMRLTFVFCEAAAAWALAKALAAYGLPPQRVLLYAWHPLTLWEFSSGGHMDALVVLFVSLALLAHRRGWEAGAGAALAGAAVSKLFPILLFPALYRRWRRGWKMPAAFAAMAALVYAPYVATYNVRGVLGFLPGYASEEGLRSGERFYLINLLPARTIHALGLTTYHVFVGLIALAFLLAAAWAMWGRERDEFHALKCALALATIFMAALSPGYDWYYCWLVPFLCFLPYPWLFWLTSTPFILYLNWYHSDPTDVYLQNSVIFLPAAFLGLWRLCRPLAHRQPAREKTGEAISGAAMAEG